MPEPIANRGVGLSRPFGGRGAVLASLVVLLLLAHAAMGVELGEVIVRAPESLSSASSVDLNMSDLRSRPHASMMEILSYLPGLSVGQHQGGGKAPQWFLRGFDADHGTDVAVSVDGLPVNLVSHAHGQGYADVNLLIPETLERITLRMGPYFADLGDFATAGAVEFSTRDEVDENFARAEGGSFETQRYVAVASPRWGRVKNLTAAQAYFTDGPFADPQNLARYNFFTKFTLAPTTSSTLRLSASVYEGDWDASGQIPRRAVEAGGLALEPHADESSRTRPFGRFDSVDPYEGGGTDREDLNLVYHAAAGERGSWTAQVYGVRSSLKLFSNFTFFRDTGLRFRDASGNPIPGDGIEQRDERLLYGGRMRLDRDWSGSLAMRTVVGLENRNDHVNLGLHRQVRRSRFFSVNQLAVEQRSFSAFLQHEIFPVGWIRLEAGLRGDLFLFDGFNRLGAEGEDPNFAAVPIAGHQASSIVSPKVNLTVQPVSWAEVFLDFGDGFHSNDARNVLLAAADPQRSEGQRSPLAKATGYEAGFRSSAVDRLDVSSALWLMDLSSELVFSGDTGSQQMGAGGSFLPKGSTRRWGVDFRARYGALPWLLLDYDLSWADPRFRQTGLAIPLAPTLWMNGGATLDLGAGFSASLRGRFLGDRPADEERTLTARGYFLLDLLGRYRWHNLELSLTLLNLTNTDWREAQFSNTSCLLGEVGLGNCMERPGKQGTHPDPAADLHFTPGNPLAVRGGLALFF